MKLSDSFIRHTMDDTALVVPVAGAPFHGIVQGNRTVAVIVELLEHETTEDEIVAAMCDRFDGDPELIRADVADVISRLRSVGAIDDSADTGA